MFDNVLFTDLTDKYIPLLYLTLENFDAIPLYSWGFAVLALLYRHLYLAYMKGGPNRSGDVCYFYKYESKKSK